MSDEFGHTDVPKEEPKERKPRKPRKEKVRLLRGYRSEAGYHQPGDEIEVTPDDAKRLCDKHKAAERL